MSLRERDLVELAEVARLGARRAGDLIAASAPGEVQRKKGHSEASRVVTGIDREAEKLVLSSLAPTIQRFDLGLLTEERADNRSRFEKDYFWCVDPLDGTLPFIEGHAGYAVSIALVSRDGHGQIGVVYLPAQDRLYCAIRNLGLTCNGALWTRPQGPSRSLLVSADRSFSTHSRHAEVLTGLQAIAESLALDEVEIRIGAGAVANACQTLNHPAACYFKFPKARGGGSVWDFAATACLFREAGAVATDIDGGALGLNQESTWMSASGVLFATSDELARRIRALY